MDTYIQKLRMQGGSLVYSIPREFREALNLRPREYVTVRLNQFGSIVMHRLPVPTRTEHPSEESA